MDEDTKQQLLEYRNLLQDLQIKSLQSYDKAILSLSGGALGLSFVFIKDYIGINPISCKAMLLLSWSFWATSILSVLVSFFLSHLALNRAIEKIDNEEYEDENLGGAFDLLTRIINFFSGILFILGTTSMVIFAAYNI